MKMNFAVGMNANERMDEIAEHARVAEESGFNFVTYVDQPFMSRDVFASMTIAAMNTHRIRMDPGVVDLTTHHPLAIAGAAASIDELSGGRAIVGIGPGGAFGETMKPRSVKDLRNAVEFIRRFTSGDEHRMEKEAPGLIDECRRVDDAWTPRWNEHRDAPAAKLITKLTTGLYHMVGRPEDICEKIHRVGKLGVRTIATVTYPVGDKKGMLREIGDKVMSHFRS